MLAVKVGAANGAGSGKGPKSHGHWQCVIAPTLAHGSRDMHGGGPAITLPLEHAHCP
jgi:hypothetical protein